MWGAFLRFAPASLLLMVIMIAGKLPVPSGRGLIGTVMYGLLGFGGAYVFLYLGLRDVLPGMAQVVLALAPLLTLFFVVIHRQETFRWRALLGALISAVGIVIVFIEQLQANVPLFSLIFLLLGAACLSESGVIIKGFPEVHPVSGNAIGMASGSVLLYFISLINREPQSLPARPETWTALIYLILFGSCMVFILLLYVLKRMSASTASYQLVLMPFITLGASSLLTGERLSAGLLLGALLVIGGVYLGAFQRKAKLAAGEDANLR